MLKCSIEKVRFLSVRELPTSTNKTNDGLNYMCKFWSTITHQMSNCKNRWDLRSELRWSVEIKCTRSFDSLLDGVRNGSIQMTRSISGNWENHGRNEKTSICMLFITGFFNKYPEVPSNRNLIAIHWNPEIRVPFHFQSCAHRWINWNFFWYWNSRKFELLFRAQFSFSANPKMFSFLPILFSIDSLFFDDFLGIFLITLLHILVLLSFSRILFYVLNSALLLQCNRAIKVDRDRNSFNISDGMVSPSSISDYPLNSIPLEFNYYLMFVWCFSPG
jgi:hypothetical protein